MSDPSRGDTLRSFYTNVLPPTGRYCLYLGRTKQHLFASSIDELVGKTVKLGDKPDVYFGLASLGAEDERTYENALERQVIAFDIDAGPAKVEKHGDKVYATQEEAIEHIVGFCKHHGFLPSYVLSSGAGLHVYFRLSRPLPAEEWKPLATAVRSAAQDYGIKVDAAPTVNFVLVLRPPGTMHKSGARVAILAELAIEHEPEELAAKFPQRVALPAPLRRMNAEVLESSAPHRPRTIHKIVPDCAAMRHVAVTRGDVPEPYWRAALGIAKYCIEGVDAAHALSNGHSDYDPDETERKFERWTAGPPTCETFRGENREACDTCRHLGRIKSPIVLGAIDAAEHGHRVLTHARDHDAPVADGTVETPADSDKHPPDRPLALGPKLMSAILTKASDVVVEPIRWVWDGYLAQGKLHLVAGAPSMGKTTVAMALAATVTVGGRWADGTRCERAQNVIIWTGEDDPGDTLVPRLKAMGADLGKVYFVTGKKNEETGEALPFDPATDMPMLKAQMLAVGDVGLLIVDPIVSGVTGDSHKNTEVRRALQVFVDLAAAADCAVIGITHFSKGTAGRDPGERITGSIAFLAVARVVLVAALMPATDGQQERRILARAKSNLGPNGGGFEYRIEGTVIDGGITTSMLTWGEAVDGTAKDLLAVAETEAPKDPDAEDAETFIRDALAPGSASVKNLMSDARATGLSWRQIVRASGRIGVVKHKQGMSGGWVWTLPKKPRAEETAEETEDTALERLDSSDSSAPSVVSSGDLSTTEATPLTAALAPPTTSERTEETPNA